MFSSPMKPFDRRDLEHWGAQAPNHLVVMAKSDTMAVVGMEVYFDSPPKGKVAGLDPVENVLAKVCFIKYKGQLASIGARKAMAAFAVSDNAYAIHAIQSCNQSGIS